MGATKIFGTGRNAELLQDVKALAPDRIEVHAVGDGSLNDFVREHNGGEGVDVVISALGPAPPRRRSSRPCPRWRAAAPSSTSAA